MKIIFRLLFIILASIAIISCEDEQDLSYSEPVGSFKIVTPANGDSVVLNVATPTNSALALTWAEMDYTTPSVINYTVQIAKDGTNFANPIDLGSTTSRFASFQTTQFNLACLMAGAVPFIQTAINIRIKATSGTAGAQPTFSNSITYLVTAFGCLNQFAVGKGLTQSGWNWNNPRTLLCNDGVLTMTANFSGVAADDTFRFFTTSGDWNTGRNYEWYATAGYKIVSTLVNAMDGDKNFKNVGPTGSYLLTIDSNNKFIKVATRTSGAIEPTSHWLVGAATPGGWSWAGNNETELGLVNTGTYEVAMKMNTNEAFRVWTANDGGDSWGSPNRNFPWYASAGYTIDSELVNAADGDSNFRYTGPTGVRLFKINAVAKIISVD